MLFEEKKKKRNECSYQLYVARVHILDRTFAMSSLLRIFPEADFGTLFMKVTFRNLL